MSLNDGFMLFLANEQKNKKSAKRENYGEVNSPKLLLKEPFRPKTIGNTIKSLKELI